MVPRQAPPVLRPTIFEIAQQRVTRPAVNHPDEMITTWDVLTGADPTPNDPQRFLYPLSCMQNCSIFSGFSFVQCAIVCGW